MRSVLLVALVICGCSRGDVSAPRPLIAGAPQGLRAPFEAIASAFRARHPDLPVSLIFGTPAELLGSGAPIDVIAADDPAALEPVADRLGERRDYAVNPLCLVTREGAPALRLQTLPVASWAKTVALADPRGESAGRAAEAALGRAGVRRVLDGRLRYVGTGDQVLALVASGEAEVGFAWLSALTQRPDGGASLSCAERLAVREARFPIALVQGTPREKAARLFVDEVLRGEGPKRFAERGLEPPPARP